MTKFKCFVFTVSKEMWQRAYNVFNVKTICYKNNSKLICLNS